MNVYPLLFTPIYKPKIWGGRNLASTLGKPLPGHEPIGESWEIADLEDDQSPVANGPLAGRPLSQLVKEWGADLLGRSPLFDGRFPLLIKFLDATQTLSVQVHPDAAMAARLGGRIRVKNEAWYVLSAEPDGFILRGLRPGVDADALRAAIKNSTVEAVLNKIVVGAGQCYYLPSGTIHALGAGVTVAEVQTPSDITYRVYDWNRVEESTGRPRELHVEQALECISYDTGPIKGEEREHSASVWTSVTRLVRCESFQIERVRMVEGMDQPIPYEELVIWIVLQGKGEVVHDGPESVVAFKKGDTLLLPAALKKARVKTIEDCMWLEVTLPIASSLAGFDRPERESSMQPSDRYVSLNVDNLSPGKRHDDE